MTVVLISKRDLQNSELVTLAGLEYRYDVFVPGRAFIAFFFISKML